MWTALTLERDQRAFHGDSCQKTVMGAEMGVRVSPELLVYQEGLAAEDAGPLPLREVIHGVSVHISGRTRTMEISS